MLAISRRRINFSFKVLRKSLAYIFLNKDFSGSLTRFEKAFANYLGTKFAIGISSARRGLAICLKVLGLQSGDEVILASLNYFAMPAIIQALGLKPVFVDVEEDTGNINPNLIEGRINSKTKAIIIAHMFGRSCRMDEIVETADRHKLFLIEDCAQGLGAEYKGKKIGTFGDVGIFSLGIGKSLMCFGGGMLVSNNPDLAREIKEEVENSGCAKKTAVIEEVVKHYFAYLFTKRALFNLFIFPLLKLGCYIFNINFLDILFGEKPRDIPIQCLISGRNRLTDFQSAIGLLQLRNLAEDIDRRITNSGKIYQRLAGLNINLASSLNKENVFLNYKTIIEKRDSLRRRLLLKGIDTQRQDVHACHKLAFISNDNLHCPISEKISENMVGIPNYSELSEADIDYICAVIKECCGG